MALIICDIDGCEHTTVVEKRGYQVMGAHRKQVHGLGKDDNPPKPRRLDDDSSPAPAAPADTSNPFESSPNLPVPIDQGKKKGWRSWFGGKSADNKDKPPRPKPERRPRFTGKRQSAAELLGMPFEEGAEIVEGALRLPATARMLRMQAPWAGHVLDDAIAGTLVDRVAVQPVVRVQDRIGAVGSVVVPPLLVAQMEMHPERAEVYYPLLRRSIRLAAPYILEGLKKHRKQEQELSEVLEELRQLYAETPEAGTSQANASALDLLLADILSPIVAQREAATAAAQAEEEANVSV